LEIVLRISYLGQNNKNPMDQLTYPIFEKWKANQAAINIFLKIPNAWTAEMLSHLDFDAMTLDLQHGMIDFAAMITILQAIRKDKYPMVRLPWNDPPHIMHVLDAGAKGIICPMINTKKDAEEFVSACFYPPVGIRSFGPTRANMPPRASYMKDYHVDIRTFAQIETKEGLKNIEEIASVKNLAGLYLGPYDLSIDLGYEKVADFADPTFMVHVKKVLDTARKFNLISVVQAYNEDDAAMLAKMGFNMVTPIDESMVMVQAVKDKLARVASKIIG
jgi:4-hydroxy-2-oxoheptanedioate aldolase